MGEILCTDCSWKCPECVPVYVVAPRTPTSARTHNSQEGLNAGRQTLDAISETLFQSHSS